MNNNDYDTEASGLNGCIVILTAMAICLIVIAATLFFVL